MPGHYSSCPIPLGEVTSSIGMMVLERAKKWPSHPAFCHRIGDGLYQEISWEHLAKDVASLSDFLAKHEISPADRVAVYSPNCYEMLAWELAVTSMGAITIPVFAGYDTGNLDYILAHAEPKAILINGEERLERFKHTAVHPRISTIVTAQPSAYINFQDCLGNGNLTELERKAAAVKPKDIAFIQYTSGTTGNPKGVMLMHRNILSQQQALTKVWNVSHKSRFLSYLPWHHSFGGLFERFTALYQGATIYLEDSFGKSLDRLLSNWNLVLPTQFFSVPKIYMSLVTEAKLSEEVRKTIIHPELEFVFTAAAPLPKECGEYFKAHKVPVIEGWGLTETSPCCTLTYPGKERIHSFVGDPIPGNEIRTTEDNEIFVRGPNVMKGYFKDPDRTAKAIDHYGWFKTGDLGEITDYGLRMICRVDGLFKLSNGEKVSSMMVENALTITARWVQHALTLGSGEGFVSALVFPNFRNLQNWAGQHGRDLPGGEALAADKEIQELIALEVKENLVDFQPKYMECKAVVIIPAELTLEDGDLTPTMKVIRHRVMEKYGEWIDVIYHPEKHPDRQKFVINLETTGGRHADSC